MYACLLRHGWQDWEAISDIDRLPHWLLIVNRWGSRMRTPQIGSNISFHCPVGVLLLLTLMGLESFRRTLALLGAGYGFDEHNDVGFCNIVFSLQGTD